MNSKYLLLTALLGFTCVHAGETIDERAAVQPDGHVRVANVAGRIEIEAWDKDEVAVTGTLGRNVERLEFRVDGKHTTIKVIYPDGRSSGSTELFIRIPALSELTASGVSTDIDVRGVLGVQRLETISGDIEAEAFSSDLEMKTVSGDTRVNGHNQESLVTVTTVSGDCIVRDVAGELEATTVSGSVDATAAVLSRARIKTTNGDIELTTAIAPGGRITATTINGDVEVELADRENLDLDVETFNGGINTCFDAEVERKSKYGPGRFLRYSSGDADRSLRVETLNGSVDVCDR